MATTKISRKDLYEKVWTVSVVQLSQQFGVSDVGLAKLCKRHGIPRPPRGYWARIEAGQKPNKEPLPNPSDNEVIEIHANQFKSTPSKESESTPAIPKIEVAKTLRGAHQLVADANQDLLSQQPNDDGLLDCDDSSLLNVTVSKSQLRRSLLISSAILNMCEKLGFKVDSGPTITIGDVDVSFGITESVDTVKENLKDVDLDGEYEFHFSRHRVIRKPSGKLKLSIVDDGINGYWTNGCRKNWRDTGKQSIENCLNKFMDALIVFADKKELHQKELEERHQKEIEERKKRRLEAIRIEEKREAQKREQAQLDKLLGQVRSWTTSHEMRRFVKAVEAAEIMTEDEFAAWSEWVMHHADRLDPTKDSPPSVLDEELPEEKYHGYHRY